MTDIPYRKILGLNQQTYQCLKLALSLNLRRQVFIAVCDDLTLRDRLAAQLVAELAHSLPPKTADRVSLNSGGLQRYPKLVTLDLNLSDPNPIVQIAQWLSQSPPPKYGNRRIPMPSFQFLGIEHLTRQSAVVQRLFLTHLQSIERSLPVLESSIVLWMPRPWFRTMPQSAPEFWRCRTGVFEFVGDPTPLPTSQAPSRPRQHAVSNGATARPAQAPTPAVAPREVASSKAVAPASEPVMARKTPPAIASLPQTADPVSQAPKVPDDFFSPPTSKQQVSQNSDRPPVAQTPSARQEATPAVPLTANTRPPSSIPAAQQPVKSDAAAHPPTQGKLPQTQIGADPAQSMVVKSPAIDQEESITAAVSVQVPEPTPAQALQPLPLLQQIELLHQQDAPPVVLANAYRTLGNLYRDRIEQGDASTQNVMIAIQAYEQVLVHLDEAAPQAAEILNDLGNLYWMLSRTHAAAPQQSLQHLKQGIQAYQSALTRVDPQLDPQIYPMIQNNLGAAYADLARYQETAENLQLSVQAYQQALRYRKADVEPLRYASTQNNLGTTYWNLAQHQQPKVNLKLAIAAYSEALRYYNPQQEPLNYAMIQNNLGTAYWNLAQHEQPKEWLSLALGAYRMALRYRTLEVVPAAFAATQNNLGTAYWHMANHVKDDSEARLDYLRQAIAAYEATLSAAQRLAQAPQSAPLNFDICATHNNLGLAHYQIATDQQLSLEPDERSIHLEAALQHHLYAMQGWQHRPELQQTTLSCVLQVVRAFYSQFGIQGQNLALSKIPGQLLPQILPQL